MEWLDLVLVDQTRPFATALGIAVALAIIEIATTFMGVSLSVLLEGLVASAASAGPAPPAADTGVDLDGDAGTAGASSDGGLVSAVLGFLNPDGVPFAMWLMVALATYGAAGLGIQHLLAQTPLGMLPVWPAGIFGLLPGAIAARWVSRLLAYALPADSSIGVDIDSLAGRGGRVTIGPVTHQAPGVAQVRDRHGTLHNIRIVPHGDAPDMPVGTEIVLVKHVPPDMYRAMPVPADIGRRPSGVGAD